MADKTIQQANDDTRRKDHLALLLGNLLGRWFNQLIKDFNSKGFSFKNEQQELADLLTNYYFTIDKQFGFQFYDKTQQAISALDEDYSPPDKDIFFASLAAGYILRAAMQADHITNTLQKRLTQAILGEDVDSFTIKQKKHLRNMVAKDQTQLGVESVKEKIVKALMGQNVNPNLVGDKVWISRRDDRVRVWHEEADGQTVAFNTFFIVGGEQLLVPRDPSGSLPNILGCRCAAVYSFKVVK